MHGMEVAWGYLGLSEGRGPSMYEVLPESVNQDEVKIVKNCGDRSCQLVPPQTFGLMMGEYLNGGRRSYAPLSSTTFD